MGEILTPVHHTLHIYSVGWCPSTAPGGVTGEVVYVPSLAHDALDAQKAQLAGKIALFDRKASEKNTSCKIFSQA